MLCDSRDGGFLDSENDGEELVIDGSDRQFLHSTQTPPPVPSFTYNTDSTQSPTEWPLALSRKKKCVGKWRELTQCGGGNGKQKLIPRALFTESEADGGVIRDLPCAPR